MDTSQRRLPRSTIFSRSSGKSRGWGRAGRLSRFWRGLSSSRSFRSGSGRRGAAGVIRRGLSQGSSSSSGRRRTSWHGLRQPVRRDRPPLRRLPLFRPLFRSPFLRLPFLRLPFLRLPRIGLLPVHAPASLCSWLLYRRRPVDFVKERSTAWSSAPSTRVFLPPRGRSGSRRCSGASNAWEGYRTRSTSPAATPPAHLASSRATIGVCASIRLLPLRRLILLRRLLLGRRLLLFPRWAAPRCLGQPRPDRPRFKRSRASAPNLRRLSS